MFEERNAEMARLYESGLSLREVGKRCGGLTYQRVQQILDELGVPRRDKGEMAREAQLAIGRETERKVAELVAAGVLDRREIAAKVGIAYSTAIGICSRLNVPHPWSPAAKLRREKAARMFDAGARLETIAAECGYKNAASARTALWLVGRRSRGRARAA